VARFVRLVFRTPALQPCYLDRARRYLATIERHAVAKWYRSWHTERGSGEALSDFGGWRGLPLNQSLVFGELLLNLNDAVGSPLYERRCDEVPVAFYSAAPDSMAALFRRSLLYRPDRDAYAWDYWPGSPRRPHWEDLSHGSLDVSFVIACRESDRGFGADNLRRLAGTLARVMWNRSTARPEFSRYVNGAGSPDSTGNLSGWLRLGDYAAAAYWLVLRACEAGSEGTPPQQASAAQALVYATLAEMQPRFPEDADPLALDEERRPPDAPRATRAATIVRGVLHLGAGHSPGRGHDPNPPGIRDRVPRPTLLDASGRKVLDLHPGPNDVSRLSPGVYFIRHSQAATAKVVVTR
jgi:hypothetical protein